ncbi:MAG: hypothetical protein K2J60_00310 [Acetatifactor sp.]|nr:hypothetical protein [Acetatifactor sp.]
MQKDTFGNRTEYSYGQDGKIKDVRLCGDENWNGSAGDGAEHNRTANKKKEHLSRTPV